MKKITHEPEPLTDDMYSSYVLFGLLFFIMGVLLLFGDFWVARMSIIPALLVKLAGGWLLINGVNLLSSAEQEYRRRREKDDADRDDAS